jgi:hypothetical protein
VLASRGRNVLLADCDPYGGVFGTVFGLAGNQGLLSLTRHIASAPSGVLAMSQAQRIDEHLRVLVGTTSLEQAVDLEPSWERIAVSLDQVQEADVIVDIGRLSVSRTNAASLYRHASAVFVVSGADGPSAAFLASWSNVLLATHRPVGLVVTKATRSVALDFADAVGMAMVAALPEPPFGIFEARGTSLPGRGKYRRAVEGLVDRAMQVCQPTPPGWPDPALAIADWSTLGAGGGR